MTGRPAALAFEGISVRIGAREILRDVSLEVRPGEVVTLAG
ncbi:MAG: histidinol phosphatase, partial [Deltaproteobacteria bacterium]|nr:histidinol phosphatase [Deltaproteobacteria bacterium]